MSGRCCCRRPRGLTPHELVEEALPGAWRDGDTSGWALSQALSQARGEQVPWGLLREGIANAVVSRWLEVAEGSTSAGSENAAALKLRRTTDAQTPEPSPDVRVGAALLEANELQDLADRLPDLLSASAGCGLKFRVRVELGEDAPAEARSELNELLREVSDDLKAG